MKSLLALIAAAAVAANANVVISEVMYHPVEKAAFDASGDPVLDLSEDIHEFVEIHNAGGASQSLGGWKLDGGVTFTFPVGTSIGAGQYLVVAKNPARLLAITQYSLAPADVLGPFSGGLKNSGDTVRIKDTTDAVVDAVSYSNASPWAIGASAFGADDEWTGVNSSLHQYRGRSLERVSFTWPANDPANWLASPVAAGPSPARANTVSLATPRPVVASRSAVQNSTNSVIIRAAQQVRVNAAFTNAGAGVSGVSVEYFLDNINATGEAVATVAMTATGGGGYMALLPGQVDRTIVRWRIKAERGAGIEVVSPRADDPMPWHAYFVTPVRASSKPIYDCFLSTSGGINLNSNISQSPRRIVNPDPVGMPRASWNATEPAVFVVEGVVYDIRMRHHGSRYNRNAGRQSYKWQFPRYQLFGGREGIFVTDKNDLHRHGTIIYDAADLPPWRCRYVDLYLNTSGVLQRLEQEEYSEELYERWRDEQAAKYPNLPKPGRGQIYKSTGVVPFETGGGIATSPTYEGSGEGPYYIGNAAPIPAKAGWTQRQRYEWTWGAQMDSWIGGRDTQAMITGMWAARGDTPTVPNPNLVTLRAWLAANFDVDRTLTYIALRNWSAPFDNATHNHFIWRQGDGRWAMLPWDLDVEFGATGQNIFWDEYAVPQPDTLRGPEWIKDSFLKAYREEYKQRLFILNNTLLTQGNLNALGATGISAFAATRQGNVNSQLGLGIWYAPNTPAAVSPAAGASVLAGSLQASAYGHQKPASPPAHAGTEWIVRAAGGSYAAPVFRQRAATDLTSLPIPTGELAFGQTYFWKVTYFDAEGHPSAASTERSFIFGSSSGTPAGAIRLNEILANGRGASDFIELHNTSAAAVELSGWRLSDNPVVPAKHTLPPGTTIAAGGFHVVQLDDTSAFALDKDGQTVVLTEAGGALMDSVSFGVQAVDLSIGRNAAGSWELQTPTSGAANIAEALGNVATLKINEWLASSSNGPDWFEIFNPSSQPVSLAGLFLSDTVATPMLTQIPALSFIAAGGHVRFIADEDPGPHHANFKLTAGGDRIILTQSNGSTAIDGVVFGAQTTDVSQGRLPDGTAAIFSFPDSPSPEAPNYLPILEIAINEVLPDIELHNTTAAPVDIGGWFLSDDPAAPQKHVFTAGTTVSAGGYLTVPAALLPFALSGTRGGMLALSHGDFRATRGFGASDPGHPWGAVATSIGVDFARLASPTFGAANAPPLIGPLIIAEVMYHPPGGLPGPESDYEFVELMNIGGAPVSLTGVRLADEVRYTFPVGESIGAGERVLVAANPAALAAVYTIAPGTRAFGPWAGSLDNSGGNLELIASGATITVPGPDFGYAPQYLVERVKYRDTVPWPASADGGGHSLQRTGSSAYSNDPVSWIPGTVTPGAATGTSNNPPTVAITSPSPGATLPLGTSITISASASDTDDSVFSVAFSANGVPLGTDTTTPFSLIWTPAAAGTYTLTAQARDGRLATTTSAGVTVNVVNLPPSVTLTSPANNAHFAHPAAVTLVANATDPEGQLALVEFFDNGTKVGDDNAAPFSFNYTPTAPGVHAITARAIDAQGVATDSGALTFTYARATTIAYVVPAGTVGTQNFGGGLGHDFDVEKPVIVTKLGVFDSSGNGISTTLTVQLFARNNGGTPNIPNDDSGAGVLETLTFTPADPGVLVGASRFKNLTTPRTLAPGSYTIASYGANGTDLNGNTGTGNAKAWSTDGSGSITFVGASRYGGAVGTWPIQPDGGPVDRYAAGTFEFQTYDADGDGMPLDWEQANGMNPNVADGNLDADGDGATNLTEFLANTNPRSVSSVFAITSIVETASGVFEITFTARANRVFIVQRSADLLAWSDIHTESVQAADHAVVHTDAPPAGVGWYYRLKVSGP
jgi:Lamin Tail Domain/Bacterial Ig domain/CotH kinase protein